MESESRDAGKLDWGVYLKRGLVVLFSPLILGGVGVAEPIIPETSKDSARRFVLQKEPASEDPEQLTCRFTEDQLALLEKLNRADIAHLTRLTALVVPNRWGLEELAYSPMPAKWSGAWLFPKAIVVSQPEQVFGAYEKGVLVRWGPVSSGDKRRPTPQGLFYLNWKSPGRHSTLNRNWFLRWYFNFHNQRGLSFHEYELPGRPASHGCVRLLPRDAQWIFEWGEEWQLGPKGWTIEKPGTPLFILGDYDFSRPAPWHSREYLAAGGALDLERNTRPAKADETQKNEKKVASQEGDSPLLGTVAGGGL